MAASKRCELAYVCVCANPFATLFQTPPHAQVMEEVEKLHAPFKGDISRADFWVHDSNEANCDVFCGSNNVRLLSQVLTANTAIEHLAMGALTPPPPDTHRHAPSLSGLRLAVLPSPFPSLGEQALRDQ